MALPNRSPFLFCLALLAGCATQENTQVVEMEVQPYLVPCQGLACLYAVEDGEDTLSLDVIEGFTFEWDVRKTLRVAKRRFPKFHMDSPDFEYIAQGRAAGAADTAWKFTTYLHDTQFYLIQDTLSILGYPKAILLADSADRIRLAGYPGNFTISLTVRPGAGGVLRGTVTPP